MLASAGMRTTGMVLAVGIPTIMVASGGIVTVILTRHATGMSAAVVLTTRMVTSGDGYIVLGPNQMSLPSGWAKLYIYKIVCLVNISNLRYDSLFIGVALYIFWSKNPFFEKTKKNAFKLY